MKALLDTCTFLWLTTEDCDRLSRKSIDTFLDEDNEIYFSLVSAWEISIKVSIGKLYLTIPVREFLSRQIELNGLIVLPITLEHVTKVSELPFHHKDPFDRLLIAQSMIEDIPILSSDSVFEQYGIRMI
jgi:PIN domain nuclease of toxin-antitoxin system